MSGMLFALALFGCTDDGSACERLAAASAQTYESCDACTAAQEGALGSDAAMRADAPSVYARCLTQAQLAQLGTGTVDLRKTGIAFASR